MLHAQPLFLAHLSPRFTTAKTLHGKEESFGRLAERPPLGLRVEPTTLGYRLITSSRYSDQTLKDVDVNLQPGQPGDDQ